jgi:DNA-binding CsgD family transcriptional regulator
MHQGASRTTRLCCFNTSVMYIWRSMRLTIGLLIFSLFLSKELYAQPDSLLHTSYAKRFDYVFSLGNLLTDQQDPKRSLDTLEILSTSAKRNNDPAFAMQLSFIKFKIEGYLTTSIFEKELAHVKEAQNNGYKYEAAYGYYFLSEWLWYVDKKTEAVETALSAYVLYRSASPAEFPSRIRFQHKLATYYFYFHNNDRAKQLLLELTTPDPQTAYKTLGSFVNTLALIYRDQGNHDSSILYLKILYEDQLNLVGDEAQNLAAGNIGGIYYNIKEYDSSLKWLKYALATSVKMGKKDRAFFDSYVAIADVYLRKNDLAAAKMYIDSARHIKWAISNLEYIRQFHSAYASLLRASGKPSEALIYMDSVLIYTKLRAAQIDKSKLLEAEKRVAEARNDAEILRMESVRSKSLWVRNFAIALIVFISVIALLLINRSRLRHKEKELMMEKERNMAVIELGEFTAKLTDRNRRLSELEDEIKELTSEQDIAAKNKIIAQLQQSTILTDDEWDNFRSLFEKAHSGYIQKVKDLYPDITPAELRYMTLTKLGMNNKEMANVLGIGTNTVRNYKFRLRKKFALSEDDDLEQMIKGIGK